MVRDRKAMVGIQLRSPIAPCVSPRPPHDESRSHPRFPWETDTAPGLWWLVHTKSRNEKALAADLVRLHILFFLPLVQIKRTYGGRTTQVELPLFPGYLFLRGGIEDRAAVFKTNRAANVIDVADQARLEAALHNIARITSSDEPVDLYPGLRQGRLCRVVRGSLKGLEGVVLRRRKVCRVYVGIEMLGQSAEVEIDASLLELID